LSTNGGLLSRGLAAIFDMDGVIVDSTPMHNKAWEIYLERHGVDPAKVQWRMHGLRNDDIVRDLFGDGLAHEEVLAHGAAKERLYREMMAPVLEQHLIPGVRPVLERMSGSPRAVASNAETPNIDFVLDGAGVRHHFLAVVDGAGVERPKPHPDIYLKAASMLGVAPGNCVVFEDSIPGVQAARAAGTRVVALTTTLSELPAHDFLASDFTDEALLAWLAAQQAR
jgi:HAD superfamily hydrolase (TIGR01509 family)